MKIQIELDERCQQTEVIIRCAQLNEEVTRMQKQLQEIASMQEEISFFKENTEYFVKLSAVLFFETDGREVYAHTAAEVYRTPRRLYELEKILPACLMRVSKSTILNLRQIYALDRTLSAACTVSFSNTHKQVFVSRRYYPALRHRLEERRSSV